MPFGQCNSSYCDTGYPEYVALRIRTFLSTPENVVMMRDLGKTSLDNLNSLANSDHAQKSLNMTKRTKERSLSLSTIEPDGTLGLPRFIPGETEVRVVAKTV